jgi:hypothetical protein
MTYYGDLCRNYIEFFCDFFADFFTGVAASADFLCIRNIMQYLFSGNFFRIWLSAATATPVGPNLCEFFFLAIAKLGFVKKTLRLPARFFTLRCKLQCFEIRNKLP